MKIKYIFGLILVLVVELSTIKYGISAETSSSTNDKHEATRVRGDSITFTELLNKMEEAEGWVIFENLKVKFKPSSDALKIPNSMDALFNDTNTSRKPRHFKAEHLEFFSCEFDEEFWLVLDSAKFDGHLSFINCTNIKAWFVGCTFDGQVRFNGNNVDFVKYDQCTFNTGFKAQRTNISASIEFADCKISSDTIDTGTGLDMHDKLFQVINNIGGDVIIMNCYFNDEKVSKDKVKESKDKMRYFIDFSNSKFKNLSISNSHINSPVLLYRTTIEGQFYLFGNEWDKFVFTGVNLNPLSAQIEWEQISNHKLYAIAISGKNFELINGDTIMAEGLPNDDLFSTLISSYQTIYRCYKEQDNKKLANVCYVEWKNLESKYIEKKLNDTNLTNNEFYNLRRSYWFNWLYGSFCSYGTDPILAIMNCLLIIFIFSLVYLVAPLEVEKAPSRNLKTQISLYYELISSPNSNLEVYETHIKKIHSAKSTSETTSLQSKFLFRLIGYDFLDVSKYILRMENYIFSRLNYKPGKSNGSFKEWFRQSKKAITFYAVFLVSILLLIFIRLVDSFFLSLNVFTTLGFGELKVKGIAIYITIFEGFIGWLLLGLFSISLLNQVLT